MTKEQLRRIIRDTVNRKLQRLDEAPEAVDPAGEVAEFVMGALAMWLDEDGIDLIGNNAWEMMMGTLGEDEIPVPGRVEDVDHFAQQAAEKVLSDPDIKDKVAQICKLMLESAMDNFGTPGPGGR
jgi:hypothetical protein